MRETVRIALMAFVAVVLGRVAVGQATTAKTTAPVYHVDMTSWEGGAAVPNKLDVVIIGRVVEFEPEVVTALPFVRARKEHTATYKVANLTVEDRLLGAVGVTRIRVGFRTDVPDVAVSADMDGCFALSRHPTADFYLLVSRPVSKKDAKYAAELDRLKKVALAVSDPVATLRSKDLNDRFDAAHFLLYRYQTPRGSSEREPIPDEVNKLILALLAELPWNPPADYRAKPGDRQYPYRSILWYKLNAGELGFKRPEMPKRKPGAPPVDFDRLMDEATTKFLKENRDKITLKRFVPK